MIKNSVKLLGIEAPSRARKLIKKGDILFATVRPTLKRIAIVKEEYDNQVCSTGFFVLKTKDFAFNKFIFYFLQSKYFISEMKKLQKGSSYPAVNDSQVKNQIIRLPKTLIEQQSIVSKLDLLFAETQKLESIYKQILDNLEELKKSILQKAFNGEL